MRSELIAKALRRAYELGKIYWQQADSESYKQNRLSEGTQQKFEALIEETILAVQAPAAQPLTQLELDGLVANVRGYKPTPPPYIGHLIARAVEAHHGIGIAPSAQGEKA